MHRRPPAWKRRLGLLLVGSLIGGAPAPLAAAVRAGGSTVFQALLNAAQKEFDAGNFERAGELFVEIWKQDKNTRAALYNASRAYQLAGKLDKAEERFREMLALADLDPAVKAKCENQLAAIAEKRSEQKAEAAAAAETSGQMAAAAGLWADALRLQPGKLAWQLRLARALHLAGQKAQARAAYAVWLAAAPADAADRGQALAWHEELAQGPAAVASPAHATVATGKTAAPPASVIAPAESQSRWPAWTALAVGAVGLVGGGALLAMANADDKALQERFATRDSAGHIVGMTPAEAAAETNQIESAYLRGWVPVGVGAAACGLGVWLWLRKPEPKLAVLPAGNGVVVAVRF